MHRRYLGCSAVSKSLPLLFNGVRTENQNFLQLVIFIVFTKENEKY